MPNARPSFLALVALLLAAPSLTAQQPDSASRADSVRADSVRRAELARIRAEPRAGVLLDTLPPVAARRSREDSLAAVGSLRLSLTGEGLADFSPRAAARGPGSRLRAGDVRIGVGAVPTRRLRADLALTLRNDSTPQITTAAITWDVAAGRLALRVGRQPVPFGIAAPRQRVDLWFPDHPLPVRAFLGQRGIRATGAMLTALQTVGGLPFALRVGVFDRFGERIDSLVTPEPADQDVTGLTGFARLSTEWSARGTRVLLGASSISGKREQPIGCVYRSTVGPVPCPERISGANTRISVLGGDALVAMGRFSVEGEWMRNVVGATDLPVFSNAGFAPYYAGMYGTYDGGYAQLRWDGPGIVRVGARAEWAQNPAVGGLNDGWAGGFVGVEPTPGGRIVLSYLRRLPSENAKAFLDVDQREALDRVVLRGVYALGWLLQRGER